MPEPPEASTIIELSIGGSASPPGKHVRGNCEILGDKVRLDHPEWFRVGETSHYWFAHDDYCGVYDCKPCNCEPELLVELSDGRRHLFRWDYI